MIYYKTHLFAFSEVNMEKRLQTFILRAFAFYYHKLSLHNESAKTLFSNTLSWKSLIFFLNDTKTREVVKTDDLAFQEGREEISLPS